MSTENLTAWERWELASIEATPVGQPAQQRSALDSAGRTAGQAVKLPTAQEIELIHQQAHDEGFRKGKEDGFQAGLKAGQAEIRAEAERIAGSAAKLERALGGLEAAVADEVLALALEVAREVIRQELAAQPESLLAVVREALAQLPHLHAAIYLHPEDASLLRSYLGDQLAHAGHRIHEDPKLARGDCVIEAGGTQVDATVAMRWQRVLERLGLSLAWQATREAPAAPAQDDGS